LLDRLFGDDELGHYARPRAVVRRIYWAISRPFLRGQTLLDVIVVIASDPNHADELRDKDMLVIEGKPTDDITLRKAGVERAHALMVMLGSDSEALLTVLTARSYNAKLYITAANVEEELTDKMMRVGANAVITPFDVAGQFLNNATLRPAVSDFFNSIMFSQIVGYETTQLYLYPGSTWIGSRIGKLNLRERFSAGIIGLRHVDNSYMYAPNDDYPLHADEVLIAVAPAHFIEALNDASLEGVPPHRAVVEWSHPHTRNVFEYTPKHTYSILEADSVIQKMSQHYVICGTDRVARNAINKLNPERPFVIISDDNQFTSEQIKRGFRVIHGNPTHEEVLRRAGVDRALAIMVSIDDKADTVLTVLTCRSLSDRLLITATASSDDMVRKLHRAGADRVASPFHIAAQFVLLATTRPAVSDYFQYVLFNYHAELETTELYMQTDSPWIGESIESLQLERLFRAGVIGVRLADGTYRYAPPGDHVLQPHEVMIVVTPMVYSDELREAAHGGITKRPTTLRKLSVSSGTSPL
ncbi:MAG: NAD-binding protein, partial [Burkholderiales bacterium]|nr:NAD-binding protein [Anaerolineae bacterium]